MTSITTDRADPLVIAFAGFKGSVGKTTSAVHVAAHLAYAGERVLLPDGDRIRTATAWGRSGSMATLSQAGKYDAVVIDSRGGLDDADLVDLAESSAALILPSTPDLGGMDGMAQTVEALRGPGVPASRYAAPLTMVRLNDDRKLQNARGAQADADIPMLGQSEEFWDADNAGVLVRDVKGDSLARGTWSEHEHEHVTCEVVGTAGESS